ncbi:hypothetical protein NN561_005480 [Cricetulus griseus]
MHYLFPCHTINSNNPPASSSTFPPLLAEERGRQSGRPFPRAAFISSRMTGGPGCRASFTVEWFPPREGGSFFPPSPLIPTNSAAEPSQRGKWVRRVLHGEQRCQAAAGPGNLALLPPPSVASSDLSARAAKKWQLLCPAERFLLKRMEWVGSG